MIYLFLSDMAMAPRTFHLPDLPCQSTGLPAHHPDQRVAPGHPVPGDGSSPHHPPHQLAAPPPLLQHHPGGRQGEVPGWPQYSHPADDSLRPGAASLAACLCRAREVPEGEVRVRLSVGQVC